MLMLTSRITDSSTLCHATNHGLYVYILTKALDAIPWKDRQWGHAVARNAIAAKSKLGMGVKKSKNVKSRRVKKTGKKN